MIIVDIQGVGNVLTDPLIHCVDKKRFQSNGNFGYEGILRFFMTHKCNKYCKNLGLIHPEQGKDLPEDFSFFSSERKNPKPENPNQRVYKLCDLCKHPFNIKLGTFYQQRLKMAPQWCQDCSRKNKETRHVGRCIDCKGQIVQSMHWYRMLRHDPHERCYKCRVELRAKLRS